MIDALVPPILVVDSDGWLSVFGSIEEAEGRLESPDVEVGEYIGWDSRGTVVRFAIERHDMSPASWWKRIRHQDPVRLSADPSPTEDRAGLLTADLGVQPEMPLSELVQEAVAAYRAGRLERLSGRRLS